jgi:hypothetical protein
MAVMLDVVGMMIMMVMTMAGDRDLDVRQATSTAAGFSASVTGTLVEAGARKRTKTPTTFGHIR